MNRSCHTCKHLIQCYQCKKQVFTDGNNESCPEWYPDDPHVELNRKPPLGCSPYYVSVSARICELCEAIKRCSTESGKHNQIKLWVAEIQYLNEMDRMLRRVEEEKVWVENKDGTLKEVE